MESNRNLTWNQIGIYHGIYKEFNIETKRNCVSSERVAPNV